MPPPIPDTEELSELCVINTSYWKSDSHFILADLLATTTNDNARMPFWLLVVTIHTV
jgi:hypothetical protein